MRHLHHRRRPAGRPLVALLAGTAIAVLVTGCASETAAQIGVRAVPVSAPAGSVSDSDLVAAVLQRLADELAQANTTADAKLAPLSPQSKEFLSLQPVLAAERIGGLDRLGAALIDKRLAAIYAMRAQVVALQKLTAGQKAPILAQLDHASNGLSALRASLLAATLPDVARNDVRQVADFHVLGFVDPVAHMTAAANEVETAAGALNAEAGVLQTRITTNAAKLLDPAHDQALLADLLSRVATARQQSAQALASLGGLSAAGYPGNRPALVSAHGALQSSRVEMVGARNDANLIVADLGG